MDKNSYGRKKIQELLAERNAELANRYLKKNHKTQPKLVNAFNDIINIREENDNFKYGAVACLDGACLDYIFAEVFGRINPIIIKAGYQFRIENIVKDLNDIFNENAVIVLTARKDREHVAQPIKDIVKDFVDNVLTDKVLTLALGNKVTVD